MSVLENWKKKLLDTVFGARNFDSEVNVVLLAPPGYGKSAIRDAFLEASMDSQAPRTTVGLAINPHEQMTVARLEGYAPPTPLETAPFDGTINVGGRHLKLNLLDPAGELIDLAFDDQAADEPRQAFVEAVTKADLVVVVLPVGEVLERTKENLEPTLRNLAALAIRAIEARREAGGQCSVAIVYTKADEVGVNEVGASRLVGDSPGERRALRALQVATLSEAVGKLNDFTKIAAVDPLGSPEWSKLRAELLVRTSVLWDVLARCQSLDTRCLNGYVISAKPVEREEGRRTPWVERGVLHVFHDFFEEVRTRNAKPAVRWWMLALGAVLALAPLACGLNAAARARSIYIFNQLNREGPDRREVRGTPRELVPLDAWEELRRPFAGRDDVAEATFVSLLNERYAELAKRLRALASERIGNLEQAKTRLAAAATARQTYLDRNVLWDDILTAPERAEVDRRPELHRLLENMRDVEELLDQTDRAMSATLSSAPKRLASARARPLAERMNRLRDLEDERKELLSRHDRLKEFPGAAIEYFSFEGIPLVAEPTQVGESLLTSYAVIVKNALEQLRLESKQVLDESRKDSAAWKAWLLESSSDEVAFVKSISPQANVDPLTCDFYVPSVREISRPIKFGSRRTMVILRIRSLQTQRTYDLDLSHANLHEVKNGNVAAETVGSQWDASKFEVLSVHVMPGQPPLAGGYKKLDIVARGRTSGFWLPAFLAALNAPAVSVGGLTAEMKPEWDAFRTQMQSAVP